MYRYQRQFLASPSAADDRSISSEEPLSKSQFLGGSGSSYDGVNSHATGSPVDPKTHAVSAMMMPRKRGRKPRMLNHQDALQPPGSGLARYVTSGGSASIETNIHQTKNYGSGSGVPATKSTMNSVPHQQQPHKLQLKPSFWVSRMLSSSTSKKSSTNSVSTTKKTLSSDGTALLIETPTSNKRMRMADEPNPST